MLAKIFVLVSFFCLGAGASDYPKLQFFTVRASVFGARPCGKARLEWKEKDRGEITIEGGPAVLAQDISGCEWMRPIAGTYQIRQYPRAYNESTAFGYDGIGTDSRSVSAFQQGPLGAAKNISLEFQMTDPRALFDPISRKFELYPIPQMRRYIAQLTGAKSEDGSLDSTGKTARLEMEVPVSETFAYQGWDYPGRIELTEGTGRLTLEVTSQNQSEVRGRVLREVSAQGDAQAATRLRIEDYFQRPAETDELSVIVIHKEGLAFYTGHWKLTQRP